MVTNMVQVQWKLFHVFRKTREKKGKYGSGIEIVGTREGTGIEETIPCESYGLCAISCLKSAKLSLSSGVFWMPYHLVQFQE